MHGSVEGAGRGGGDLIGMGDKEGALVGAIMVQDMHDLHRRVGLARSWRADHHCQPWLYPRLDGFHLHNP